MFKLWKWLVMPFMFSIMDEEGGGAADEIEYPEGLEDDVKNDPSLKVHIQDNKINYGSMMKSYVHAQRQIGKEKTILPTKNSTDEDWGNFYTKLGRPELDKYDVKASEGMNEDFFKNFKTEAHNAGLLPNQAQKLMDWYSKSAGEINTASAESNKAAYEKELDGLKTEWGKSFEKEVSLARHALKEFATPEEIEQLKESGLLGDVKFTKLMNKIGKGLNEDTFDFESHGDFGITKSDAEAKINAFFADAEGPYLNSNHPAHKKAVEDMQKYQQVVYS